MGVTLFSTKQLPIVTVVADPGLDTTIPTEQAVREAIDAMPGGNVIGPALSTNEHLAVWDGTDSLTLKDGGAVPAGGGDVVGPAGATADDIAVFDAATGKVIKDGGVKVADLAPSGDYITSLTSDVVAAGPGAAVATIAVAAVTLAKMADLVQDKIIGRATASTGVPEAITCTGAGRALLDDADAAAQLATLGAAGVTTTQTLTNKRLTPRIYTTDSIAGAPGVLTPEIDTYDYYEITAQAAPLDIANMSTSTPVGGEKMIIALTCDGTARALTYGTDYVAKGGVALPSTLIASKTTTLGFQRNAGLGKWNLLAVAQEA